MRRIAASFIRGKLASMSRYGMLVAGVCFGLAIGTLFYAVLPQWIGIIWAHVATATTLVVLVIVVRAFDRPSYRWNLDNLKKGVAAETRVGQIIERAVVANNCAVAHSVTEIAKIGDIDHIVATPVAVRVIETKYKKVPPKKFPKVLDRIAANMEAVRQWAPYRAKVQGCLVLAYESENVRRDRWGTNKSGGKEDISVYARPSLDTLEWEMREEAAQTPTLDKRLAEEIWKLG